MRCTLQEEVEDLREWQNGIDKRFEQRIQTMESETQHEKKEVSVIHDLVKTFNQELIKIETSSQKHEKAIHDVNKEVESIKDNVNQMLSEVPQVTSIESRFASIEEKMSNFTDVSSSAFNLSSGSSEDMSYNPQRQEEIMIAVTNEVDQRQRRRRSLVVHNLVETGDPETDCMQIKEILHKVTEEESTILNKELISSYRLGKLATGRNRTIKVHLKSEEFCSRVIQSTQKIRNSPEYSNIVIQPDLTPLQRRRLKSLVQEKKLRNSYAIQCGEQADWVIREGGLCRKYKTSTTQDN